MVSLKIPDSLKQSLLTTGFTLDSNHGCLGEVLWVIHPTNPDSLCCGVSGSLCSCNCCLLLVPRLHTRVLFTHSRGKPSHSHGVLYWISGPIEHFGTRLGWLLYRHDFFSLLFTHSTWQRCQLLLMFGTTGVGEKKYSSSSQRCKKVRALCRSVEFFHTKLALFTVALSSWNRKGPSTHCCHSWRHAIVSNNTAFCSTTSPKPKTMKNSQKKKQTKKNILLMRTRFWVWKNIRIFL